MGQQLADELTQVLVGARNRLLAVPESELDASRGEGTWSKRQILGHLIDSTAANHQRFVRAQFTEELRFPQYDAPGWVVVERYDLASWPLLVDLFVTYARFLVHVVSVMPANQLDTPCWVDWYGEPQAIPLSKVASEYLDHVRHHLGQLTG